MYSGQLPSHYNLCESFSRLSRQTWNLLRNSIDMRFKIGEESITDWLLFELKRRHEYEVTIWKCNRYEEGKKTGADWLWWFIARNFGFGIQIQAKKLKAQTQRFEHLKKLVGNSDVLQVDKLIDSAKSESPPLHPMYCFYSYCSADNLPWPNYRHNSRFDRRLYGCTLANAVSIRELIKSGKDHLSDIGPLSFPWSRIVCNKMDTRTSDPLPYRVKRIIELYSEEAKHIPNVTGDLPPYVEIILSASVSVTVDYLERLDNVAGAVVIRECG